MKSGATAPDIRAQALGTFRWQLPPYCNVVALSVRQDGGIYTLVGVDHQCGNGPLASATGLAFLSLDGSIGFGLSIVTAPGIGTDGRPVISYFNSTGGALRVTRCGNTTCTSGNVTATLDNPINTVGPWTIRPTSSDCIPRSRSARTGCP